MKTKLILLGLNAGLACANLIIAWGSMDLNIFVAGVNAGMAGMLFAELFRAATD